MADQTITVQLVPAELDTEHIEAETLLFGAILAAGVVVLILKWLHNYLMAGGRDD